MDFKIIVQFWRTYFFFNHVNPEAGLRVQCVVGYVRDLRKEGTEEQSTNCYTWDTLLNPLPTTHRQFRTLFNPNGKVSVES